MNGASNSRKNSRLQIREFGGVTFSAISRIWRRDFSHEFVILFISSRTESEKKKLCFLKVFLRNVITVRRTWRAWVLLGTHTYIHNTVSKYSASGLVLGNCIMYVFVPSKTHARQVLLTVMYHSYTFWLIPYIKRSRKMLSFGLVQFARVQSFMIYKQLLGFPAFTKNISVQ